MTGIAVAINFLWFSDFWTHILYGCAFCDIMELCGISG